MILSESKILVTRTDRLGDVLLATPVLKKIREFYPHAKLSFLVREEWMPILQYGDEVDLIAYRPNMNVKELAATLSERNFDVAIVLRDEAVVSQAVKRAEIPVRVGPYSTLRSLLTFNQGLLQRRSRCSKHEAEYNLELLQRIKIPVAKPARVAGELPHSWIHYQTQVRGEIDQWQKAHHMLGVKFWCIHPGSSGSARYLQPGRMMELVYECMARLAPHEGARLVITGGSHEESLLQEIKSKAPDVVIFGGEHNLGLAALAELYRRADLVIAHGTGPLHLAAAVDTRVLAIFPPLHVLSERRWGPLTAKRLTWIPAVECPEKYRCRGPKCKYYDCMDRFEVGATLDRL
ncbi:MAG: glycosyltransferase family 9 protein [Bdellovibrionales bacterium]|nr:glycosyltransferase family 9 protein [Bdellovibrionales bacterium]